MRALLLIAALAIVPVPAEAWGFVAHRLIADRAIDALPADIRPLFDDRRSFVVEHAVDPDLWRSAGWVEEPPNHFVDLDHPAFGPYPFAGLPRNYDEAVQKFGRELIHEQGLLPWRVQEFAGRLRRAFEALKQPDPPAYVLDDVVYFSAILAHYVADGHVPLHAVTNYDGQATNQQGVHSRWEAAVFERVRTRLTIVPTAMAPVTSPRDFMFDTLLTSNRLAAGVLEADRLAAEGREFYDEAYFEAFGKAALPVMERRFNDSIGAVAAVITGAWEQAGRPRVPTAIERTPRRIRRP
jgi:hypothetical protein